jgi:hypothetical protein
MLSSSVQSVQSALQTKMLATVDEFSNADTFSVFKSISFSVFVTYSDAYKMFIACIKDTASNKIIGYCVFNYDNNGFKFTESFVVSNTNCVTHSCDISEIVKRQVRVSSLDNV